MELEADVVDQLSHCMLRMRGQVRWEHERAARAEQEAAVRAADGALAARLRQLDDTLRHQAEVVHILRCTEQELASIRAKEILGGHSGPGAAPTSVDSFASMLFSPLPDRRSHSHRSSPHHERSRWGQTENLHEGRDAFREFAAQLHALGRQYCERQTADWLREVDEECELLVRGAEEHGEQGWVAALDGVNTDWAEGGSRRQDFARYMQSAREQQEEAVRAYTREQECTAAQFAVHEARAELARLRDRFERAAAAFFDRQLGAETEAALAVVLDTAARPDAYRARPHNSPERNGCSGSGSGRSNAGGAVYSYEDQISGPGPHHDAAGVTLEEANTVAAQAVVQARASARRVQDGLHAMRDTETETLRRCVRYVLMTEARRGNKLFTGQEGAHGDTGTAAAVTGLLSAWGSGGA